MWRILRRVVETEIAQILRWSRKGGEKADTGVEQDKEGSQDSQYTKEVLHDAIDHWQQRCKESGAEFQATHQARRIVASGTKIPSFVLQVSFRLRGYSCLPTGSSIVCASQPFKSHR